MSDLVRMQVLLEKRQRDELGLIAEAEGRSLSELIRRLVDAQLRQRKYAEMRAAAEKLRENYVEDRELTAFTALDGEDFLNE
jgi:hypothetical protein